MNNYPESEIERISVGLPCLYSKINLEDSKLIRQKILQEFGNKDTLSAFFYTKIAWEISQFYDNPHEILINYLPNSPIYMFFDEYQTESMFSYGSGHCFKSIYDNISQLFSVYICDHAVTWIIGYNDEDYLFALGDATKWLT
jgi:hypothetical protein